MRDLPKYAFDAASLLSIGRRDQQEDAIVADFGHEATAGFVVLADGMGGHAAGDVASSIVVETVSARLKTLVSDPAQMETELPGVLRSILSDANEALRTQLRSSSALQGMGTTLIAPIVLENRLYWISVGDSPLYLFRGSRLFRLNENHSVAGLIDILAAEGEITREQAQRHPDRHCLTSVMNGAEIAEIDCRHDPFALIEGDIVIAASDGLESIGENEIARVLFSLKDCPSSDIGAGLMQAVSDLDHPDQDNVSACIIKIIAAERSATEDSTGADIRTGPMSGALDERATLEDGVGPCLLHCASGGGK